MFNSLVDLDEAASPSPDLAEAWEASGDGLSMTFRIRREVLRHDGQPFTAQDVNVTFQDFLFRFHTRAHAGLAPAVTAFDVVDPHTVTFRLKRPQPAPLRQLLVTEAPILPAYLFADREPTTNLETVRPIGTGVIWCESWRRDGEC